MASRTVASARGFFDFLQSFQKEENNNHCIYEDDFQILKLRRDTVPVVSKYCENPMVIICQKADPKSNGNDESKMNESSHTDDEDHANDENDVDQIEPSPQPLTVMKARQILSWYTLSQNPCVSGVANNAALHPLWVRCDMSDPAKTMWMGAETVCTGTNVSGVILYSITSKDSAVNKEALITLDEVKREHKKRHHTSLMQTKGTARFNLFGSTVVENTLIKSQSSITVDLNWSHVDGVLETPPLSSTATLNIRVATGDLRSPMSDMYRELEFLQSLADGLRTGETEWIEPLESTSAIKLTKAYLEEIQDIAKTSQDRPTKTEDTKEVKPETDTPIFSLSLLERSDFDFVEELWVRLRKSVASYQDITDSLKLVIGTLSNGQIKPWIHKDSNSSLSKLILQSHKQQIDVSLTGLTPIHMLLEMGLDKIRKDYVNYLIGEELATLNHLCYYLSTEVDLQEQVSRLRKLHHLLETTVTCRTFLGCVQNTTKRTHMTRNMNSSSKSNQL
ncbi:protein zwilch homolog isoform X2 [Cynoglossus semilaevis]|uniref:protein zwilch homolog isoform X2 n=1 Tax=Cynoglossus semilaevis TaxID=244447 RepID=UPI000495FA39|nr:protein zwilch homolog isoform X2 [Cynoglossus semilaevis]